MGLDTKTYWLTDRQSQCDFDFDLSQEQLAVSTRREQSAQETQVKFSQRGSWEQRRQTDVENLVRVSL
jgi:hypothetical protein